MTTNKSAPWNLGRAGLPGDVGIVQYLFLTKVPGSLDLPRYEFCHRQAQAARVTRLGLLHRVEYLLEVSNRVHLVPVQGFQATLEAN